MVECRYGTPGFGAGGCLQAGFREVSGADVRVVLGYVQKGVPSSAYREVLGDSKEGLWNLTSRLTEPLTPDLTGYLTTGLTKSRVVGVPRGSKGGQDTA
ncbi:Uncharacterised protein [Mycobacteroides abscessus subsp. abscessus]|nr:Uncharacterised protein [Mycobacteroides abscessus subsp. abscessus]SKX74325.1 Uncharacterised protein [Mycobacteroides abscessus subsp. abscessus]